MNIKLARKVSIKGILLGVLAEGGMRLVIMMFVGWVAISDTHRLHAVPTEFVETPPYFQSAFLLATYLSYVLGGLIAGYVAKSSEILNATLLGFVFFAWDFLSAWNGPIWIMASQLVAVLALNIFGGYAAHRLKTRNNIQPG